MTQLIHLQVKNRFDYFSVSGDGTKWNVFLRLRCSAQDLDFFTPLSLVHKVQTCFLTPIPPTHQTSISLGDPSVGNDPKQTGHGEVTKGSVGRELQGYCQSTCSPSVRTLLKSSLQQPLDCPTAIER